MKIDGIAIITVLFSTLMGFIVSGILPIEADEWNTLERGQRFPLRSTDEGWVAANVEMVKSKKQHLRFEVGDEVLHLEVNINHHRNHILIRNAGPTELTYYVQEESSKLKRWVQKTIQPGADHGLDSIKPKLWA
ncbi:hypothetical protein PCASD_18321 [Puccinia coronata f. sp. avenae]|uniref:Uncharacterized protein n=1 Tax=Puccinia coronata f. sp. avenae TaxID=200324 RepID=A0A2N5S7N0_9BASI|nr:hypothetical protein PCASD_18321 [Puccinia coronata f. sp. avenae]